jgi:hypothetical protein
MLARSRFLKPMLDSGSARVFNCNDRSRLLLKRRAHDPFFFRTRALHGLVLIKEVRLDDDEEVGAAEGPIIGTKVYLPYNHADIYEGGRSIFLHDDRLWDVLGDLFGLNSADRSDLEHDQKILDVLGQLPSLDGFLMRDALEIEGIAPNEQYFEVSASERIAIHEFIRGRFEPLVCAACHGEALLPNRVKHLVDKIWEAKDEQALAPLTETFRFPREEALQIFAAWKGVIFYTFEYQRTRAERQAFAQWLALRTTPKGMVDKLDRDYIDGLRSQTIQYFRRHWSAVEAITRDYETLYARFVNTSEGVHDFLSFLRGAHQMYWRMGDGLSRINHAIFCWKVFTRRLSWRVTDTDTLCQMLNVFRRVLRVSSASDTAAEDEPEAPTSERASA